MKNFKKILALILVVALTATVSVGLTLALLTDETEIKHNVFTSGDVDISLTEKVDGDTYGGVETTPDGGSYKLVAPGDELTKEVTVKNTGSIPAYVAVTVTMNNLTQIKAAIEEYYPEFAQNQIQAIYDQIFETWFMNYTRNEILTINKDGVPVDSGSELLQVDAATANTEAADNWFETEVKDNEITFTYYLYMEPNDAATLFTGINVPEYFKNAQMAMFNNLEIDIQGAAIQAENFTDAKAAFQALEDEQNGLNVPDVPEAIPDGAIVINTAADLQALSGKSVDGVIYLNADIDMQGAQFAPMYIYNASAGANVTLLGNGHTISNINLSTTHEENGMYNGGLFHVGAGNYGVAGNSLTVSNLTVENATFTGYKEYSDVGVIAGYVNSSNTVALNNVDVVNANINNEYGNAGLLIGYTVSPVTLTDCDVSGTVSGEVENGVVRADKTGAYIGTANQATCIVTVTNCTNNTTANNIGRVINGATVIN